RNAWGDNLVQDYLMGIMDGDRIDVLYSSKDYSSEWHVKLTEHRDRGEVDDPAKIAVNIVVYALTRCRRRGSAGAGLAGARRAPARDRDHRVVPGGLAPRATGDGPAGGRGGGAGGGAEAVEHGGRARGGPRHGG